MATKNSLLYRLRSKDFKSDVYLFGTMHVKDQKAFVRYEDVCDLIQKTEGIATEFSLDQNAQSNRGQADFSIGEGKTLEDLLSAKKYAKVQKMFEKELGIPFQAVHGMKPMVIQNMLVESFLEEGEQDALDMALAKFAASNEKLCLGIETYEEQMEIMRKIPIKVQLKGLYDMSKNLGKQRRMVNKMVNKYVRGDVQELFKQLKKQTGGLRKILLYRRNKIMADRIFEMAKAQPLVFAIGAGHFGGSKGVLRLLKKKGVKLRAL